MIDYRILYIEKVAMYLAQEKMARKLSYKEKQHEVSDSECGYIDKDGKCHFPMPDKKHVRNAMARFNQTKEVPPSERPSLARKIISRAKAYGIEIDKDTPVARAASE